MATTWQEFEEQCFRYLKTKYGNKCIFELLGNSDSTQPDIKVTAQNNKQFFIEVKQSEAQSGQFVLLPNLATQKFDFSPRNKSSQNEFTDIIMDFMNQDFENFNNAGTAGKSLNIDSSIFSNWMENYYISKDVQFFITKGEDFIIFPASKFSYYFDITASYRIKRSGSTEPSKKYQSSVISELKSQYEITDTKIERKKLFVISNLQLENIRFKLGDYEYFLSNKQNNVFEVRQLSNTYNMNVIFSISLKSKQNPPDLDVFLGTL